MSALSEDDVYIDTDTIINTYIIYMDGDIVLVVLWHCKC